MPIHPIKPANKKSVAEDVFRQLLSQIINGAWVSKSKLPSESELCKIFNVSRISIRSALKQLNALGIIETRHGEGSFIKGVPSDILMNPLLPRIVLDTINMLDIMEYRKIIECGTVALDVDCANAHDLLKLEAIIEEMDRYKNDTEVFAAKDLEFHIELAKISGNSIIIKVIELLRPILLESVIDIIPLVGQENGIYFHRQILDALREKNRIRVQQVMAEHIDSNIISLKAQLAKSSA